VNQYPQKLFLVESNPSITRIPPNYALPTSSSFGGKKAVYMASYYVSHKRNCFANENITPLLGGGSKKSKI
jgi:hypothetical protein